MLLAWHTSARWVAPAGIATALLAFGMAACVQEARGSQHAAADAGGTLDAGAASNTRVSSGGLGPWMPTADYPLAAKSCAVSAPDFSVCASQTCVASAGYVYCLGGASTSTFYSQLSSVGMGAWVSSADYPASIQDVSCVVSADHIYCVGGRIGDSLTSPTSSTADVYFAPLSSPGIGAWTASTPFPHVATPQCMTASGFIYCISAKPDDGSVPDAYYAPISASGVGQWAPTAAPPRGANCTAVGDYVYCFGAGNCPPGGPASDCYSSSYYAPLTPSGIGTWQATTELPTAVSALYATADSYIYYLSTPIFVARVSAQGIGPWEATTNYPSASYPSTCFSSGAQLYCASAKTSGSYFAQVGAPNPRALQLEDPPPFPRAEYLGPAWTRGGGGSVTTANGVFAGGPIFYKNIDDAIVFDCASQAATPAGCTTRVVSPTNTAYNYDLTIWYPCTQQSPADTNCCFRPAVGYPDPFHAWCSSVGSNSFIIADQIKLQPSQ